MSYKKNILFEFILSIFLMFPAIPSFAMEEGDKGIHPSLQSTLKRTNEIEIKENNNILVPRKDFEPFDLYKYPCYNKFIFLKRIVEVDICLMQKSFNDPDRIIMILDQRLFCKRAIVDKPFLMITHGPSQVVRKDDLLIQQEDPIVWSFLDTEFIEMIDNNSHRVTTISDFVHKLWHDLRNHPVSELISEARVNFTEMLTYERLQEYKPILKNIAIVCLKVLDFPSSQEELISDIFRDSFVRNHQLINENFVRNPQLINESFEKLKNWFSRCFNGLSGDDEDSEANS